MTGRRRFLTLLGSTGAAGLAAVAGMQMLPGDAKPTGDPVIRYGKENCARCHMVISDRHFAAAWREPNGTEYHFDDIGCMVFHRTEKQPAASSRFWVQDYETEVWLDGERATYVVSDAIRSPMSYGVAASTTPESAQRLVSSVAQAKISGWDTLAGSLTKRGSL